MTYWYAGPPWPSRRRHAHRGQTSGFSARVAALVVAAGLIWETRRLTSETSTSRSDSSERAAVSALRPLVGRDHELATIEELLAAVRAGGSGALVVRGDPGIGKSALLQQLIASASEFQVVRAIGVEGEIDFLTRDSTSSAGR